MIQEDLTHVSLSEFALLLLFMIGLMFMYYHRNSVEQLEIKDDRITSLTSENNKLAATHNKLKLKNDELSLEKDKLTKQNDSLSRQVVNLQDTIKSNEEDIVRLASEKEQLQEEASALQAGLEEAQSANDLLQSENLKLSSEIDAYFERIAKLDEEINLLVSANNELKSQLDEIQANYVDLVNTNAESGKVKQGEAAIRKQLLGLSGHFSRVVFVFDCSSSMKKSGRWEFAVDALESWISYLGIDYCSVLTYNRKVHQFPEYSQGNDANSLYLDMTPSHKKENIGRIKDYLGKVKPEGVTNLIYAIRMAYKYEDTSAIVLFTDGAPTVRGQSLLGIYRHPQKEPQKEIIEFLTAQKNAGRTIPVNIVATGDYFNKECGRFLVQVADLTGGTFIGR
jgi:Mg-chelatase subunit ChlD